MRGEGTEKTRNRGERWSERLSGGGRGVDKGERLKRDEREGNRGRG